MKKLASIIDQIDCCRTLILRNETADLRMAFILLDNAAETLMYRKTLAEFGYNELYGRIIQKAKELPSDLFDKFRRENNIPEILEAKRKWRILQYFDEKVTYLCQTCALIHKPVASVLSSLHRYRNEIYHRDIVRTEILRPVAILYFEIVCDLMEQLPQGSIEYNSNDDWTAFFRKYNLSQGRYYMLKTDEDIPAILNGFRTSLAISTEELKNTLTAYLANRFTQTFKNLAFLRETLSIDSNDTALKVIQFDRSARTGKYDGFIQSQQFKSFQPAVTESTFDKWRQQVRAFEYIGNKSALLIAFKLVEDEFEPIEKAVSDLTNDIDAAIQFQIDLARGK